MFRLCAFTALFGFIFTIATPGLASNGAVSPLLIYVCHVPAGDEDSPASGKVTARGECCVLCQAAQLIHGAVPAEWVWTPPLSAPVSQLSAVIAISPQSSVHQQCQARAPPVV